MALVDIADKDLGLLRSSNIKYKDTTKSKRSKDGKYTVDAAPYDLIDPQAYAEKFGGFNRGEFGKNFADSEGYALETLNTELQGLQGFVPAAGALKRRETSADNVFNAEERRKQIESILPYAAGEFKDQRRLLGDQTKRATAYAEGRLPDARQDRAFELGLRSRSADVAGFSGIGPNSSEAEKMSDLLSAEKRFEISQYGENLLGQNINARTATLQNEGNVFIPPTQYSNVGAEVRSTPEVGAGQLRTNFASNLNSATMISPSEGLSTSVNQRQFQTNLEQRTREFNAGAQMQLKAMSMAGGGGGGGGGGSPGQMQFDRDYQALVAGYQSGLQQQGINAGSNVGMTQAITSNIPVFADAASWLYDTVTSGWSDE